MLPDNYIHPNEKLRQRKEAFNNNLAMGQFYENGYHTKFQVTELTERHLILTELTNAGKLTEKRRKFNREVFAGLIYTKVFEQAKFGRREAYMDLRELEVGKLFTK